MTGNAVGRNDPCPCGSGKKYKKCCLEKESATARARPLSPPPRGGIIFEADIDKLSNAALDAIEARRFDEAERLCAELLREYPEALDGHDRYAILREAQGRFDEAADHCTRAIEMIARKLDGPSPELIAHFEQRRDNALAKASPRP